MTADAQRLLDVLLDTGPITAEDAAKRAGLTLLAVAAALDELRRMEAARAVDGRWAALPEPV